MTESLKNRMIMRKFDRMRAAPRSASTLNPGPNPSNRLNRLEGSVESTEPGKRPLSTSYVAVHQRIWAKRGKASEYQCVAPGCDKQARDWAWQLTGPFLEAEPTPHLAARKWGTEVEDYAPMCKPHAARLDMGGTLTHCPAGHERTERNTYVRPNGSEECRSCKSQEQRERKARKVRKTCTECGGSFAEAHIAKHIKIMHLAGGAR